MPERSRCSSWSSGCCPPAAWLVGHWGRTPPTRWPRRLPTRISPPPVRAWWWDDRQADRGGGFHHRRHGDPGRAGRGLSGAVPGLDFVAAGGGRQRGAADRDEGQRGFHAALWFLWGRGTRMVPPAAD